MAANLPPEQQQELLALYNEMSDRHPDTPELEYSIALLLKVTGQPQQALDRLRTTVAGKRKLPAGYHSQGRSALPDGQKSSALDYLLTNTRRFPGNRQMGTLYGRMLINEGELQAAQDEFNRLVKRYPDTPGPAAVPRPGLPLKTARPTWPGKN